MLLSDNTLKFPRCLLGFSTAAPHLCRSVFHTTSKRMKPQRPSVISGTLQGTCSVATQAQLPMRNFCCMLNT